MPVSLLTDRSGCHCSTSVFFVTPNLDYGGPLPREPLPRCAGKRRALCGYFKAILRLSAVGTGPAPLPLDASPLVMAIRRDARRRSARVSVRLYCLQAAISRDSAADLMGNPHRPDPYLTVAVGGKVVAKSKVWQDTKKPFFFECLEVPDMRLPGPALVTLSIVDAKGNLFGGWKALCACGSGVRERGQRAMWEYCTNER